MSGIGKVFKGESVGDAFLKIRGAILNDKIAKIVPSRICDTRELLNPTIIISDPTQRLFYSEHRSYSLVYGLVEAYMLFSGTKSVKPFALFNPKMNEYSDDGATINSAYGSYIAKFIPEIISKLRYDPNTRQAVMNIYSTKYGLSETKDVPCTLNLHFLIRDGALNLTVYMRSNDLFFGWQYDVFMFTTLQEIVARELGIPLGVYIHCPTSLHVYEYHWDMLKQINANNLVKIPSISFDTDVSGATSASTIIERLCDGTALVPTPIKNLKSMLPIHLILLEYLFRHDKPAFDATVVNIRLQDGWFAPFVKRWYKEETNA